MHIGNEIYRHENKYIVNEQHISIIKSRLSAIMKLDAHSLEEADNREGYTIRSVYFDDRNESCYFENEDGIDPREKFRIRIYNNSDRIIHLELKKRNHNLCHKEICSIDRETFERLIRGEYLNFKIEWPALLKQFWCQIQERQMRPVVVVFYNRIPFVNQLGNVRVTIDMDITSSVDFSNFFSKEMAGRPVMPCNRHVLEVKWDDVLPSFIYHALSLDNLQWTNYSKYYFCRKYGMSAKYMA